MLHSTFWVGIEQLGTKKLKGLIYIKYMLQVLTIHLLGLQLLLALQSVPNVTPEIRLQAETLANIALNFKESDVTPTVTTQTAPTQVQIVGSIPLQASTSPVEAPKVVIPYIAPKPVVTWNNTVSKQFGVAGEVKYVQVSIAIREFIDGVPQFSTTGSDFTTTINGRTVTAQGKSIYNDFNNLTFPLYQNGTYTIEIKNGDNTKTETVVIDDL